MVAFPRCWINNNIVCSTTLATLGLLTSKTGCVSSLTLFSPKWFLRLLLRPPADSFIVLWLLWESYGGTKYQACGEKSGMILVLEILWGEGEAFLQSVKVFRILSCNTMQETLLMQWSENIKNSYFFWKIPWNNYFSICLFLFSSSDFLTKQRIKRG